MPVTTNKLILVRGERREFYGCFGREFLAYNRAWELANMDETITAVIIKTATGEINTYDVNWNNR